MKVFMICAETKQYKYITLLLAATDLEQALEVFFKDNPKDTLFGWEYKNVTNMLNNNGFFYKEPTNE